MSYDFKLVLRLDQRYGRKGQTIPPGTPVATVTFAPGLPANLKTLQFLGSAIAQGVVMDAKKLPAEDSDELKPWEPERPVSDRGTT